MIQLIQLTHRAWSARRQALLLAPWLFGLAFVGGIGVRSAHAKLGSQLRPEACVQARASLWETTEDRALRNACGALAAALPRLRHDPSAALQLAQRAANHPQVKAVALRVVGQAALALGKQEQALTAFRGAGSRFVDWDPGSLRAYALTRAAAGDLDGARLVYATLLRYGDGVRAADLLPSQIALEFALVTLYSGPDNAEGSAEVIRDLTPDTPEVALGLVAAQRLLALLRGRDLRGEVPMGLDALESIGASLSLDLGRIPGLRWMLVAALCQGERPALAADAWRRALELLPPSSRWRERVAQWAEGGGE